MRLIIFHTTTRDGTLVEQDHRGVPVYDLRWSGDTTHSIFKIYITPMRFCERVANKQVTIIKK